MSVTLSGDTDAVCLNWATWAWIQEIAVAHGWEPAGTEASDWVGEDGGPDPQWGTGPAEDWDGRYNSCDGQWVTPTDAKNLGDAIARAISNGELGTGWSDVVRLCRTDGFYLLP